LYSVSTIYLDFTHLLKDDHLHDEDLPVL
jgi:hypothetical protein